MWGCQSLRRRMYYADVRELEEAACEAAEEEACALDAGDELALALGEMRTLVLAGDVLLARTLLALREEAATLPAAELALQSAV